MPWMLIEASKSKIYHELSNCHHCPGTDAELAQHQEAHFCQPSRLCIARDMVKCLHESPMERKVACDHATATIKAVVRQSLVRQLWKFFMVRWDLWLCPSLGWNEGQDDESLAPTPRLLVADAELIRTDQFVLHTSHFTHLAEAAVPEWWFAAVGGGQMSHSVSQHGDFENSSKCQDEAEDEHARSKLILHWLWKDGHGLQLHHHTRWWYMNIIQFTNIYIYI